MPIFVHSLFRSGSTYLFNVFRRTIDKYTCYQEPLHELAVFARENPEILLEDHGDDKVKLLRHPSITDSYFQELYNAWPAWNENLTPSAVYGGYFAPENQDNGIKFWNSLINVSKNRPVFHECRTSCRIHLIRKYLNGYHIYLWRNPWDQWWSYKVASYFDVTNQLIINAPCPPSAVQALRLALGFEGHIGADLAAAFNYYGSRPLTTNQSYLIFYMLWCLGLREGVQHADLLINIDQLSDSESYRNMILSEMNRSGINEINFSDCRIPQGCYLEEDRHFFEPLEQNVHQWLLSSGWQEEELERLHDLRHEHQPASWDSVLSTYDEGIKNMGVQASRARSIAMRFEDDYAKTANQQVQTSSKLDQVEERATQAEARATQAEAQSAEARAQVQHALTVMQQAQGFAAQAEARANQAEERATQAETRATQAEAQAAEACDQVERALAERQQAQVQAGQAEVRANQAEERATQAEARAMQAEAQAAEARDQVQHALNVMQQAQGFAAQAEVRANQAEERATQAETRAMQAEAQAAEACDQVEHALAERQQAQVQAGQAEVRANQAEERATQAEARATQAEAQAAEASAQVQHALTVMKQAQEFAAQAEARANGLAEDSADLSAQLARTQEELHQIHQANHHHWQQLEATRQELHHVHQANHHHWQLANDRQRQLEDILGSTSIRITAPLRRLGQLGRTLRKKAKRSHFKPSVHQSRLRRVVLPLLNWSVVYARRSPRFKGYTLTILKHMPGLGIKLRQLHLETQIAQYPQHTGSADSPNALHAADNLVTSSGSNTDQLTTRAVSEGIHAQQRTPLEAHFRAYGGRE